MQNVILAILGCLQSGEADGGQTVRITLIPINSNMS
jgi:hypothetical protein